MTELNREHIWDAIVDCLRELMEDQELELGEVNRDMCLWADLGVSSVDSMHLIIALEDRLQHHLSFDEMLTLPDGQIRKDLTLGELSDLVASRVLPAEPAGAGG